MDGITKFQVNLVLYYLIYYLKNSVPLSTEYAGNACMTMIQYGLVCAIPYSEYFMNVHITFTPTHVTTYVIIRRIKIFFRNGEIIMDRQTGISLVSESAHTTLAPNQKYIL